MAKGKTTNATNLGIDIITPNRLKLGRNNYRSLEGSGIKLDMSSNLTALLERNRELYCEWYRIFIENIHMLDLRPKIVGYLLLMISCCLYSMILRMVMEAWIGGWVKLLR